MQNQTKDTILQPDLFGARGLAELNRRILTSPRLKQMFVSNPKAGCTTVKKAMFLSEARNNGDLILRNEIERNTSIVHKKNPFKEFSNLTEKEKNWFFYSEDIFRYTFARNPYTRILSAYLDKFVHSKDSAAGRNFLKRHKVPDTAVLHFAEFVRLVAEEPHWDRDVHWREQYLLTRPDVINYSYIGRFERIDEGFAELRLHYPEAERSLVASDLGGNAVNKTSAASSMPDHYDDQTIELVARIYSRDFEAFGYSEKYEESLL
ncbi:MAG: sulfotransferase family protein [Hyphomicrobiaceae bacterium]|nr:sulfotransferase family protein [Hyphomicrobiaceae bacterium]